MLFFSLPQQSSLLVFFLAIIEPLCAKAVLHIIEQALCWGAAHMGGLLPSVFAWSAEELKTGVHQYPVPDHTMDI